MPPAERNSHPLSDDDLASLEDIESDLDLTSLDELEWELQNMNGRATVSPPEKNAAAESAAIDSLLGELDLEDVGVEAAPEVEEDEVIEEVTEEDLEAVEASSVRSAAYQMQDAEQSEAVELDPAEAATKPADPAPVRAVRTSASKSKGKPVVRDLSALPAETFVLLTDLDPGLDMEAYKDGVICSRPSTKKVAEKFDNLFVSLARGVEPSHYVMRCFEKLVATGTASLPDLVTHLNTTCGYTIGTARAQAGQIVALFPLVGIATRSGNTLTLNATSAVAEKLKNMRSA